MKKLSLAAFLLLSGGIVAWFVLRPLPPAGTEVATAKKDVTGERPTVPAPTSTTPAAGTTSTTPAGTAPKIVFSNSSTVPKPPGQPTLADLLRPGNRIHDAKVGLTVTYPENWTVRDTALRWGANNGENTLFFAPPDGSQAVPSLYYRKYSDGPAFDMANPEATLRDMAAQKETSRTAGGQAYKNDPDSFVFRTIDGQPSLSYYALYTENGQLQAEYFLRILGPTGYVMFFNRGPAADVQKLIPDVFKMAGTVKAP